VGCLVPSAVVIDMLGSPERVVMATGKRRRVSSAR
jgi:hypothetical protein